MVGALGARVGSGQPTHPPTHEVYQGDVAGVFSVPIDLLKPIASLTLLRSLCTSLPKKRDEFFRGDVAILR